MVSELEKYVYEKRNLKNQGSWESICKDCLSLLVLAVVLVYIVILKSNLERIRKQNIYMPITIIENP